MYVIFTKNYFVMLIYKKEIDNFLSTHTNIKAYGK